MFFALILSVILIAGCGEKAPKVDNTVINSGRIVTVSTIMQGDVVNKMTSETVFSGNNARSSTKIETPQGQQEIIQIWIDKKIYNYAAMQPFGQSMVSPIDWKATMTSFAKDPQLKEMAQLTGTEEVSGMMCDVYTIDTPQEKAKVWVLKNENFPILLKSETTIPFESQTIAQEIAFNIDIPETAFEIPSGIEFQEVNWNDMMGGQAEQPVPVDQPVQAN